MGYVYVLLSLKDNRSYTGSTDNIERRFNQHTSGQVKATKDRLPVKILFTEIFETLSEARKREKWWKSGAGRRKLIEYFNTSRS
jgi:putative endonuclease